MRRWRRLSPSYGRGPCWCPQYVGDEEMKKTQYHDMLRADIRKYVSYSACLALDDMIVRAGEREIDIEHIRKRKAEDG